MHKSTAPKMTMNPEQLVVACGSRNLRIPTDKALLDRTTNGAGTRWSWTLRPPFASVPRRYPEFSDLVRPVQLIIDPVAGNNAGTYELWMQARGERAQVVCSVELKVRAKSKIVLLPGASALFLREDGAEVWVRLLGPIGADTWTKFFTGELLQQRRMMYNEAREFPIDWANSRPEHTRLLDAYMIGLEPVRAGSKRWQYVKEPKEEVTEGPLSYVAFDDIYDFSRGARNVPNQQIITMLAQTSTMGPLIQVFNVPLSSLHIGAPENGKAEQRSGLWIALGAAPRAGNLPHRPLLAAYDVQIIDPQRSIGGLPLPLVDGRFREQIWSTFGSTPFTVLNLDVRCDDGRVVVSPESFELDSSATPLSSSDCERRHYYLPLRLARPGPAEASRAQDWYDDVIGSICRHMGKAMQFGWLPVGRLASVKVRRASEIVEHLFLTEIPPVHSFAAFALFTFDEQPVLGDQNSGRPFVFGADAETGQEFPTPQSEIIQSLVDAIKLPQSRRLLNNDPDDDNDDNLYIEPQLEITGVPATGMRNLAIQRKLVSTSVLVWRVCKNSAAEALDETASPLALTRGTEPFHEQNYKKRDYDAIRRISAQQIESMPTRGDVTDHLVGTLLGQIYRLNASRSNASIFLRQLAERKGISLEATLSLLARASAQELTELGLNRIPDSQDFTFINSATAEVLPAAPYTLDHVAIFETDKLESRLSKSAQSWFCLALATAPANLAATLAKTSDRVLGMLAERCYMEAQLIVRQVADRHMKAYLAARYDIMYTLNEPNLAASFDARSARIVMRHVAIWTGKIKRAQDLLPIDQVGERAELVDVSYSTLANIAKSTYRQLANFGARESAQAMVLRAALHDLPTDYVLPIDSGLFPDHITAADLKSPLHHNVYATPGMTRFSAGAVESRARARFAEWCSLRANSIARFFGFSPDQEVFEIGEFSPQYVESGAVDPQRMIDIMLLSNYLFMIRDAEGLLDVSRRDAFRFSSSMSIAALGLDRGMLATFNAAWSNFRADREWAQLHKLDARLATITLTLRGSTAPDAQELLAECNLITEFFEKIRRNALTIYFSTVYGLLRMQTVPDNLPDIILATRKELERLSHSNHVLFGSAVSSVETRAKRSAARLSRLANVEYQVTVAMPTRATLKTRASRIINDTAVSLGIASVPEDLRTRLLDSVNAFPSPAMRKLLVDAAAGKDFIRESDGDWDADAFQKFVKETFDEWFKGESDGPLKALAKPPASLPQAGMLTVPGALQPRMPAIPTNQPSAALSRPPQSLGAASTAVGQTESDVLSGIMSRAFAASTTYVLPDTFGGVQTLLRNIKSFRGLSPEDSAALSWVAAASLLVALPEDKFVSSNELTEARQELARLVAAEFARLAILVAPRARVSVAGTTTAEQAAAARGALKPTGVAAASLGDLTAQFFEVLWRLRAMRHLSPRSIVARYATQLRVALYYGLRTHPSAQPLREIVLADISLAMEPFIADVAAQTQYLAPISLSVLNGSISWDSRPTGTFTGSLREFVSQVTAAALDGSAKWTAARNAYTTQLLQILTNYVIQPQQGYATSNKAQWLLCQQQAVFFRPDRHEPSGLSAAFNTYIGAESDPSRSATSLSQSVWSERLRQLNDQIALDESTIGGGLNDPFIALGLLDPRRKREMLLGYYTPEMFAQLAIASALKTYEEQGPLTASVVPLGLLGRVIWTLVSNPQFLEIRQRYGLEPFRENTLSPFQLLAPGWIVRDSAFDMTTGQARDEKRFTVMTVPYSRKVFEALDAEFPAVVRLADKLAIEKYAPRGLVDNGRDLWRLVIFGEDAKESDVYIGRANASDMRPLTTRDYAELVTFSIDFADLVEDVLQKIDKNEQINGTINAATKRTLDSRDADIIRDQAALADDFAKLAHDLSNGLIAYGSQYSERQSDLNTRQAALDSARTRNDKARATATRGPIREALVALDRIKLMHACFVFVLGYLAPQPPTKPIFVQQLHPDGTLLYDYFSGQLPLFVAQEVYSLRMAKYSTNAEYRDTFRRLVGGKLWGPAEPMNNAEIQAYKAMILQLNWNYNCRVLLRVEQSSNPFARDTALLRGTAFCYADSRRDASRRNLVIQTYGDFEGSAAPNKLNIGPYSGLDLQSTAEFPEGRDAFYTEQAARYPFEPQERYSVYDWREGRRLFFNPTRAAENRIAAEVPVIADSEPLNIWNATNTNNWPYPNVHNLIELMPSYSPALRFFELFFEACDPRREQTAAASYINELATSGSATFANRAEGLPQYQTDTGRGPEDRVAQRQAQLQTLREQYDSAVYWFIADMGAAATSFYQPKATGDSDDYRSGERHLIVFDEADVARWLDSLTVTTQLRASERLVDLLRVVFDDRAQFTISPTDDALLPYRHPEQQFRAMSEFVARLDTGQRLYRDYIERVMPIVNAEILRTQREVDDIFGPDFAISWS